MACVSEVGGASAETGAGQEREGELGGPQFHPPLYRQRYEFVLSVCRRLQASRVCNHVEMGSREGKVALIVATKHV